MTLLTLLFSFSVVSCVIMASASFIVLAKLLQVQLFHHVCNFTSCIRHIYDVPNTLGTLWNLQWLAKMIDLIDGQLANQTAKNGLIELCFCHPHTCGEHSPHNQ